MFFSLMFFNPQIMRRLQNEQKKRPEISLKILAFGQTDQLLGAEEKQAPAKAQAKLHVKAPPCSTHYISAKIKRKKPQTLIGLRPSEIRSAASCADVPPSTKIKGDYLLNDLKFVQRSQRVFTKTLHKDSSQRS
jgi:hypothetical protein